VKPTDIRLVKTDEHGLRQELNVGAKPTTQDPDRHGLINRFFSLYRQGTSIILCSLHDYWEPVADLRSELELFFHHPVCINMYLTPGGARAFGPHFDTHDVFILQIHGSKSWKIYSSFVDLPEPEHKVDITREMAGNATHEIDLQSGDFLYIPRGFVHEAHTPVHSSIHLTIALYTYKWFDVLQEIVASLSEQDTQLRESLPAGFMAQDGANQSMREHLTHVLQRFSQNARIEDAVQRLTARFIKQMSPPVGGHFTELDRVGQIDQDTLIRKRKGMFCRVLELGNYASIQFPGNQVRGPSAIGRALRFIAENEQFMIRALPGLKDESKLVLVRRLIGEGLLFTAR
jgi:ribosomal protein L16 Arg81 hydroxylase